MERRIYWRTCFSTKKKKVEKEILLSNIIPAVNIVSCLAVFASLHIVLVFFVVPIYCSLGSLNIIYTVESVNGSLLVRLACSAARQLLMDCGACFNYSALVGIIFVSK